MTAVNVNRSLTTCSIINSFLKVIVWMLLVATLGSFIGDPSGGPPRDLLLVANKKSHLVPDKNKMMNLATQVAKPSLVLSLPTTTVSNCTAAVTAQKKNKIIGSFVEKINLEEYFEELVKCYRNITSSRDFVTWEEKEEEEEYAFLLVRPPFLPSTTYKNILDGDDEFLNNKEDPPLPFAEVLDRIAAELFLGVERIAKWNVDFVGNLFWMVRQEWCRCLVAIPSLALSLPTTTVSNCTAVTAQKKKDIFGSFVEKEDLEELVKRYRNITSSRDFVTWEEKDAFLLVRPPFFPSTTYKNISDDDDEFLNNKEDPPLPFAEVLDQIAAELFLGVERIAKWNVDSVGNLFWMIRQEWCRSLVAKPSLVLSLSTTTVSNCTAVTAQKKKDIFGSFVEKEGLEELVKRYRNITSSRDFVTWEEKDAFLLVRPPFFPSTSTYKNISDDDDEFLNSEEDPPLPFAEVLDRVAAELFLGVERIAKWYVDFVGNLFSMVQQEWCRGSVAVFDLLLNLDSVTKMSKATSSSCLLSVSIQEKFQSYCDIAFCYLSFIFRHRIVQELGPFILLLILFLAAFDSIYLKMIWLLGRVFMWFKRRRRHPWGGGEVPYYFHFNNRSPQRQIVTSSSKRKRPCEKTRRKILPFEWHSMGTRLSYKRFRFMLWLQEQYRDDHKKYMRARKFYRDSEFFHKANRGRCALQYGVFIEQILEEDDKIADEDHDEEVVSGGGTGGNDVWYNVVGAQEEDDVEDVDLESASVETTTTTIGSSSYDTDNPELDGDNVHSKTHEEVVGTFFIATSTVVVPTPKPTVDPSTNLGSGFYIDSMGRTRRFSHRLLAKKKEA